MHMCWVRVSAGAKVPWTTVTVVTDHGALQNTAESIKMQFAAIRIRILSGLCNSHVLFNVPSFRFFVRNFRFFGFVVKQHAPVRVLRSAQTGRPGRREIRRIKPTTTTKPKKSKVSHKKSKTWYVEKYMRIA